MISRYFVDATTRAVHFGAPGDSYMVATCDNPELAARLHNDAMWLNDKDRKYTAAARKIAEAEALPGYVRNAELPS